MTNYRIDRIGAEFDHIHTTKQGQGYTRKLCDARYISSLDREPLRTAEIWPFEIIQDGEFFEFFGIENSAVRSAVPENPTL